jgi:hypothetical protein
MFEAYKEIGFKEIESELKAKKFTKKKYGSHIHIQRDEEEGGEREGEGAGERLLENYVDT